MLADARGDISKHRHEVLIAALGKTRRRRMTITNTTDDFMRLIAILREYGQPDRIGFEATGNYHRVLMYHLGVAGFDLKLVSSVALARTRVAWRDNVFVERLWRTIKYAEVYLHASANVPQARASIRRYLGVYNGRSPQSSLDGKTPDQAYLNLLTPVSVAA